MKPLLYIALALAVGGVVFALARGVVGMAQGRDISDRTSNKYMSLRVIFQFAAVLIVLALAYLGGQFG
jgi:chaperone required for assembly of F1-ATPase